MHIDKANLTNLTGLWKKYGLNGGDKNALALPHVNARWPHRCWFDGNMLDLGCANDTLWLDNLPESSVLPIWPMIRANNGDNAEEIEARILERNWVFAFAQVAMYLELKEAATYTLPVRDGFQVLLVRMPAEARKWVEIASQAFSYIIDYSVIENVLNDKDIRVLLGTQDGRAVATALLYKTGDVIGVHQVGVKQAFRGQGISRCLMQYILNAGAQWQGKYMVLQASPSGQPLYESLNFIPQFTIKNFQRA